MRRRLLSATLAVVAVSVLSLGLPLLLVTVRLIADSARTELLRQVQTVSVVVEDSPGPPAVEQLTRLVPAGEQVRVTLPDGTVLRAGPDPGTDPYAAVAPLPAGGAVTLFRPAASVRARQWRAGLA
ncbi:MAG TPA: hypothetical protein VEL73_05305, partial [Mycobacteriales bacterium]|nr:hypothetical protein [Mycobacteriales bacterium]